jgi:hypothetical protein
MAVRDEEIRAVEVNGKLLERRPHGFEAFGPVHAGVDHEAPIPAPDQIGVDGPERVPGERYFHPIDVVEDFRHHAQYL